MDTFDPFFGGMPLPFAIFLVIFLIFFLLIASLIGFTIIKSVGQWNKNNHSPKLSVPVQVVTKRSNTSGGSGNTSASTSYYVTFQVESGDRMELQLSGKEYGMLAEGDLGILTFQGTRFLSFERSN
ncbi:DUF2500 domain-containing protein [Bacillus sp. FJAT-22090]|uniref:DUF2500 domain-containing protein n=1 Tax=Bacillus sp. FJAT-22090 TaxID=1581038 RepID=UPI0011A6FAB4|nr:DUF2500 domain-containing protein [Bacillus sp. FJAT-22090]